MTKNSKQISKKRQLDELSHDWTEMKKQRVERVMTFEEELAFLNEVKEYIYRGHTRVAEKLGRVSDRAILEEHMHLLLPDHLKRLKYAGVFDIDSLYKFEALCLAVRQARSEEAMPSLMDEYIQEKLSDEY